MSKFIELSNVTFEYDTQNSGKAVLKKFNLSFEKGSFTAILGRNGCGKSTLAKLLNGVNKPIFGSVLVNGLNTLDESNDIEIKRTVGMVFQNPDNQLVATIVEEDVAFGPENLGVEPCEIRKRVDEALRAVDMFEYKNNAPHKLSGGQKQRVAIAGIVAMEPQCIVLDEPTAMLDPKGRNEIISVIDRLCKQKGITIILITHFMDEATKADRVIVMDDGEILIDNTPNEVFSNTDIIRSAGLDVPQPTELVLLLKEAGIDLDMCAITVDECAKALTEALQEEF